MRIDREILGILGQLTLVVAGSISAALFTELEELARIVDISYCVGSTSFGISKPFNCLSRCTDFPQFELATTWNTGPLLSDSCGYIALDHGKKRVIVAFRGTYSIANTVVDLSTVPQKYVPYPGEEDGSTLQHASQDITKGIRGHAPRGINEPKCLNCTVHMGFHSSWLNTRNQILPDLQTQLSTHPHYRLTLVGHSLGGAVAALAALDLLARGYDPVITTFGEPRVGNAGLAKYLDERFNVGGKIPTDDTKLRFRRVTHVDDPVPLLPLTEWGYTMHAGEIFIAKSDLSPDIADLQHCEGDTDGKCIAGQHSTPWGIPSRYKLWQLFFAHRDYFWRLGLCVPGGDPLGGGGQYTHEKEDL
ncbi:uncharacterized protein MYCFIDRAFT_141490 [Pseudocercospora fijiensis CIRAD86]|uniref:Fungal lipase-type domain-containing protein n=1 Tax=Pseudocercospora fijiensis (strain CIRAD86) TaxID=383855 RepID=M2YQW9_PSEFD|nr:uncharacterized protein MYCFIDRAFT_141490 [Pseudocercospora fijiensis CIRAD86]EME80115.1 hypothetical protein MYCFIDRAFT_141490 [Pseudocercospora fijiensis CIRAD86]